MGRLLTSIATLAALGAAWRILGWITGIWDDDDNLGGYGP